MNLPNGAHVRSAVRKGSRFGFFLAAAAHLSACSDDSRLPCGIDESGSFVPTDGEIVFSQHDVRTLDFVPPDRFTDAGVLYATEDEFRMEACADGDDGGLKID